MPTNLPSPLPSSNQLVGLFANGVDNNGSPLHSGANPTTTTVIPDPHWTLSASGDSKYSTGTALDGSVNPAWIASDNAVTGVFVNNQNVTPANIGDVSSTKNNDSGKCTQHRKDSSFPKYWERKLAATGRALQPSKAKSYLENSQR